MPFSQVKDVLKKAVEFHKMLVDFYSKIGSSAEKHAVKILVDYMARHEDIMKEKLSDIAAAQHKEVSDEWIKYDPEYSASCCFDDLKITSESSVDDVIDAGLKLNQCLINLYRQMAVNSPAREVKNLFTSLETAEIAEKKKLARMRGM